MISSKAAPAKMFHFISELVLDLPMRCKLVSVEVEDMAYQVTLWMPDRGMMVHQLSAYDMSRSMRGDPDAVALIRDHLVRMPTNGAAHHGPLADAPENELTDCSTLH